MILAETVCSIQNNAYHRRPLIEMQDSMLDIYIRDEKFGRIVIVSYNEDFRWHLSNVLLRKSKVDESFMFMESSWFHRGIIEPLLKANHLMKRLILPAGVKNRRMIFTGFSIGGAMAAVIALGMARHGHDVSNVITFGSPRFLNKEGVKQYGMIKDRTVMFENQYDYLCNFPINASNYPPKIIINHQETGLTNAINPFVFSDIIHNMEEYKNRLMELDMQMRREGGK
jgi:hypothetical protein